VCETSETHSQWSCVCHTDFSDVTRTLYRIRQYVWRRGTSGTSTSQLAAGLCSARTKFSYNDDMTFPSDCEHDRSPYILRLKSENTSLYATKSEKTFARTFTSAERTASWRRPLVPFGRSSSLMSFGVVDSRARRRRRIIIILSNFLVRDVVNNAWEARPSHSGLGAIIKTTLVVSFVLTSSSGDRRLSTIKCRNERKRNRLDLRAGGPRPFCTH